MRLYALRDRPAITLLCILGYLMSNHSYLSFREKPEELIAFLKLRDPFNQLLCHPFPLHWLH